MNPSIRAKILFLTSAVIFLSVGAVILINGYIFKREYSESLKSHSLTIGKSLKLQLDRILQLGIPIGELIGFEEQCRDIVIKYKDVQYAMVIDVNGKILFHNDPSQHGKVSKDEETLKAIKGIEEIIRVSMEDEEGDYEAVIPVFAINGEHIAAIRIGFPIETISKKAGKIIILSAFIGLTSWGIGMVLLLFGLSAQVTKPLRKLLNAIHDIRRRGADFAEALAIGSKDEIGEIASSFNEMTEDLRKTTISRDYADNIIGSMSDTLIVVDSELKIRKVNKAACEVLRYEEEELIGSPVETVMPSAKDIFFAEAARIEPSEELKNYEAYYKDKEGRKIPILLSSSVLKDKENKIVSIICAGRDITDLKQAEEDIRKSRKFIENILETVDEGFIVMDRDYRIISANRAYLKGLDMPAEKVIGRHCYELSHRLGIPCDETGVDCAVRHVFENGEPYTCDHTHYDNNANPVYVETKAYPVKDETGQVVSAIEIINDITERRRLAEQLRQSQKMEAVGQIAGGIAHDFNNILTAIIGYGHILNMKMKEDDPLRLYVEPILSSADRAANLTQGLLAFSRKQIINPTAIDINEIIQKMSKFLLRVIGEDIELKTILDEKDLTVMVDIGQIEHVLMNLATNARDAMPQGGALTIEIYSERIDREFIRKYGYGEKGRYAVVSVTDTGIGMDEEMRRKIFEPFFTTKEVGKGTGLGLAIVYGIIKQHKGYINCYSEQGKGTIFKIFLPIIDKPEEHKETVIVVADETRGGTETVLLAEDEIEVRNIMKSTLEESGYKVIEAKDGEDAVEKFMKNKDNIHLLFFDVVMPNMGGKEAYERIKRIKPGVQVLFASGYPSDFIRNEELLKEGYAFISKPISPTAILKKIRAVLDKK